MLQRESTWWALFFGVFVACMIVTSDPITIAFAGVGAAISLFLGLSAEIEGDL